MKLTDIQSILSSHHFIKDEINGVWRRQDLSEFAYNDGDEAENYILDTLKNVQDVGVNSTELVMKMKDWPSIYHFSPLRSNLLRPFGAWFKGKRVLEIGCGCGAITRFLGESGAHVVSVEGSLRRAGIARERCRDLPDVEVICSPSDQIPDLGQFDAVLLIGVLEYARMFLGTDGQQVLLESCRARMSVDGRLFVAIENKLGIKYFAGANEDHVNLPMYGINNSYRDQGVVTFGRLELKGILAQSGFTFTEDYLPLPDYKLPVSLVTPEGWRHHADDLAQLALESAHRDQQRTAENTFSLEQGISNIWHNGLAADLANSFLIIASQQSMPTLTPNVAAFHYSDSRLLEYRKATTFAINNDGRLSVRAEKGNVSVTSIDAMQRVVDQDDFYQGNTLWFDLVNIINRPDWRLSEVGDWTREWLSLLLTRAGLPIVYDKQTMLPNSYQDALPFNIIRKKNGELVFFDQEWESQEPISIAYIGFRGIYHSFLRFSSVSDSQYYTQTNLSRLALDVLNDVGFSLDEEDLSALLAHEARFLALIQHTEESQLQNDLKGLTIVVRAPSIESLRTKANILWIKNLALLNEKAEAISGAKLIPSEMESLSLKEIEINNLLLGVRASQAAADDEAALAQGKINKLELLAQEQTRQLRENEAALAANEELRAQLQRQVTEQASIIAVMHSDIDRILTSSSWRISAPIRLLGRRTPALLRRKARGALRRLFVGGQRVKVSIGHALHSRSTPVAVSRTGSFKQRIRHLAKSLYARAPERYKGRLLKLAMRIRPGWFLHHPFYRPDITSGDRPLAPMEQMGPAYISRDADGTYHYAARPSEYNYIATEKPYYYDDIIEKFTLCPSFSIVVPIYNTPLDLLEKMVASVRNQWYQDWELLLVNDASPLAATAVALDALGALDDARIKVIHLDQNQGIAGATNAAIENASKDYLVFLDHDDELTEDCLFELAKCVNSQDPDFIYSDEDKLTPEGNFAQPHFKPDWSPDTIMGTMYTCHVSCVKLSIARQLGGLRGEFNGCQDWDFILRLSEITNKIIHIPKVLYHWRVIPASVASDLSAKSYVLAASKGVREDALIRRGRAGRVEELPGYPGYFRVNYAPRGNPLVSIIIPTRDNREFLQRCAESIFTNTHYKNIELVVVDNGSVDADTLAYFEQLKLKDRVKVARHDEPFNFSRLCNQGAEQAGGDILLFLNDDTEVLQGDWLERMVGYAQLEHIGAVGAKLVYGDGVTLQHTGLLNLHDGPMHAYMRQNKDIPGYFLRNQVDYNWLAVTGACLMIERKKFLRVLGFDETFPIAYNDLDLCMSLVEAGFYNVMCQGVTLIHHESVSRGIDHKDHEKLARLKGERARLYDKHPAYFQYDPFFNVNLHPNGYCFEVQI